jgi:hypothetical protein
MTREDALYIDNLLLHIEAYEALLDELDSLQTVEELKTAFEDDCELDKELAQVVQTKLDVLLAKLAELNSSFTK